MTPNLRYNKKMTAKLVKAAPEEENKVSLMSVDWGIENKNHIYGLIKYGWFRNTVFYFQKYEEDLYRLIYMEDDYRCHCYIIDDIDAFMDFIGIEILEVEENQDKLIEALDNLKSLPHTGIIVIDEGRIYVYEHNSY